MSDLISREDLLERILYEKATTKNMYPKCHFTVNDCITDIKYAPSVDAVEVVRCKDCRHGKCVGIEYICRAHSGSERKLGEDRHYSEWHDGNWFCADGERKEVGE